MRSRESRVGIQASFLRPAGSPGWPACAKSVSITAATSLPTHGSFLRTHWARTRLGRGVGDQMP